MVAIPELLLVGGILLLLFGAGRIPKAMRGIGRMKRSFRSGLVSDDKDEKDVTPKKR